MTAKADDSYFLMDVNGVSRYLGITKKTVHAWVYERKIPHMKLGKFLKFDRERINKWVEVRDLGVYEY